MYNVLKIQLEGARESASPLSDFKNFVGHVTLAMPKTAGVKKYLYGILNVSRNT